MRTDCFEKLGKKKLSNAELMREAAKILDARKVPKSTATGHTTSRNGVTVSDSIGCDPSQATEFTEAAQKAGFSAVHFDKEGSCHMPNFGPQRKNFVKFYGEYIGRKVYDKSQGY
jgi:hypothetical protein